jgi:DNA-binding response OmpR family regulator
MRLLVVEDNGRLAQLMARLLAENQFTADVVSTVEEAEAALELVTYDLILLDLSLPDGDGRHILRKLRRQGRASRILVITARADVVERVATLNDGADDYLVKPFSLDELLARIRALLRRPSETAKSVLVSRRKLEEAIYSFDEEVTPNAIEAAVSRLRRRLDALGAAVNITSMRGLGYILTEREAA